MIYYPYHQQAGFTLVETLVAITILLLVIVGPLTIAATTARSTSFASEQVVAFFLAQEGAELAQMARDNLLLEDFDDATDQWDAFTDDTGTGAFFSCIAPEPGCGLEIGESGELEAVIPCTGTNCRLYLDTVSNNIRARYTYDALGTTATPYTRVISFEPVGDQVLVTSRVTWRTGSLRAEQVVEVETYLFNIYGTP